jgi:hypothetical protein
MQDYDFTGKDPNAVLTKDELEHFDEGMSLKNESVPSGQIDFRKAVESVIGELDILLP